MGIYDGLLRVYRNLRLVHMNLRLVHMNLRLVHMNALCFSSINLLLILLNPIINIQMFIMINLFIILIFNIITKIQLKVTTGNVQETAHLQTKVWSRNKIMS